MNRRTKKCYKKILYYIIEVSVVNSFLLYNNYQTNKLSLIELKMKIIQHYLNPDEKIEENSVENKNRLKGKHFPQEIQNNKRLHRFFGSQIEKKIYILRMLNMQSCPMHCETVLKTTILN